MRTETGIAAAALLLGGVLLGRNWRSGLRTNAAVLTVCVSAIAEWGLYAFEPRPSTFFDHGLPGWYGAAITYALYRCAGFILLPLAIPWSKLRLRLGFAFSVFGAGILYGMHVLGADDIGVFNGIPSWLFDFTAWFLTSAFWFGIGFATAAPRRRART